MKLVLQRVKHASVSVDKKIVGSISQGYLIFVGITHHDTLEVVNKMAKKCCDLRIFEDDEGRMNKGLQDVNGSVLSISQFTLYADCRKGRRPGFEQAAKGNVAKPLYEAFNQIIEALGFTVEKGVFGADMKVELYNDGPVTIVLDSKELGME